MPVDKHVLQTVIVPVHPDALRAVAAVTVAQVAAAGVVAAAEVDVAAGVTDAREAVTEAVVAVVDVLVDAVEVVQDVMDAQVDAEQAVEVDVITDVPDYEQHNLSKDQMSK
jgi:hypothetical protein